MCPKVAILRIIFAIGFVIPLLIQPTLAQQKARESRVVAKLEGSVDHATVEDDSRIVDFGIANPKNSRALELLARLRLRQGRLGESRALYQRVLSLDPTFALAKINLGSVTFMLGQKDEARQTLKSINDPISLPAPLKLELAAALLLVGEIQRSLAIAETLPTSVKSTTALPLLGVLYLESGQSDHLAALIPIMKKTGSSDASLAVKCA